MNTPNINYYIVSLSQKTVSLSRLQDTEIEEIHDAHFPAAFVDEYEYSKSSRGTSFGYSLKSFEKDKSFVKKERFTHFLRTVNENLRSYLSNTDCALVLVGTDKDRADFKRVFDFNHLIAGEISGSYSARNLVRLKQSIAEILHKPELH